MYTYWNMWIVVKVERESILMPDNQYEEYLQIFS